MMVKATLLLQPILLQLLLYYYYYYIIIFSIPGPLMSTIPCQDWSDFYIFTNAGFCQFVCDLWFLGGASPWGRSP